MPLFLAEHCWEKEKEPAVMKSVYAAFLAISSGVQPEGWPKEMYEKAKLCATYGLAGEQKAICIWEADSAETLENAFKAVIDIFPAETKITQVVQVFPPGPGLYAVITQLLGME